DEVPADLRLLVAIELNDGVDDLNFLHGSEFLETLALEMNRGGCGDHSHAPLLVQARLGRVATGAFRSTWPPARGPARGPWRAPPSACRPYQLPGTARALGARRNPSL